VKMDVYLGNYPQPDDNGTEYQKQKVAIVDAIKTYGTDNIAGVTVGNEFMLKFVLLFLSFKFLGIVVDTFLGPAI